MKEDKDEGWLSSYVPSKIIYCDHIICRKRESKRRGQKRHGAKNFQSKFIFLTHTKCGVLLQKGDNREGVTVEEERRGSAGGHEPTCRLGQKLWLQRGEVRRGKKEF